MEFKRTPTDPDGIVEQIELPEGHALIIADAPDYVNLPPELGGGRVDVLAVARGNWYHFGLCTHYKLDKIIDGKQLWVAKADQFYWHTRKLQDETPTIPEP